MSGDRELCYKQELPGEDHYMRFNMPTEQQFALLESVLRKSVGHVY